MDKIEDISVLFFAGSNCCPDAFAPAHTRIAASALCNTAVDDRMAYISLSTIVGRLNQEVVKFLAQSDVKDKITKSGFDVVASSPEELTATMKSEMDRMGKVLRQAGVRPE